MFTYVFGHFLFCFDLLGWFRMFWDLPGGYYDLKNWVIYIKVLLTPKKRGFDPLKLLTSPNIFV